MEFRLVIIGSGGVGKSALAIQYIQETFVEKYDPTIEDSYRKQVDVDGQAVMLDILDTAGQDEYSAMRDDYMSKGHGFLMVYSVTDGQSYDDCHKIYEALVRMKTPEDPSEDMPKIPIVLVGNKCDLEEERSILPEQGEELQQKFGDCCKFFETSAKERLNVDQVFDELVRLIMKVESGSEESESESDGEEKDVKDEGNEDTKGKEENDTKEPSKPQEVVKPMTKKPPKKKKKNGLCSIL